MTDFLTPTVTGGAVIDLVNGGTAAGWDTLWVTGQITVTALDTMARVTNVDVLYTGYQNTVDQAHSIVAGSNAQLGSFRYIDLSADTGNASSALIDMSSITSAIGMWIRGANGANSSNTLKGGAGNDIISGLAGNDFIWGGLGNDSIIGGAGNDTFTFAAGTGLNVSDLTVDGGAGTDTVALTGDTAVSPTNFSKVSNIEFITLENINQSVAITAYDQLVGNTDTLTLSAANLSSSATLTFNGLPEAGGKFNITGGAGNDTITGSVGNDTITGGAGNDSITGGIGNDSLSGGNGDDTFTFAINTGLTFEDTVDGGIGGIDTVALTTNATSTIGNDFDNVSNIEIITMANTTTAVTITTQDALVESGTTLTLTSTQTGAAGVLTFIGANESNGAFSITGGVAADVITGGNWAAGGDTLTGGLGADVITGGLGADIINLGNDAATDRVVVAAGGSGSAGVDQINGFDAIVTGGDYLDFTLAAIVATDASTGTNNAFGQFNSHSITAGGLISFDTALSFGTSATINTANLADATAYLAWNVVGGASAESVAFYVDANNNTIVGDAGDFLRVFQGGALAAGSATTDDLYVDVYTLNVTTLAAGAAANTVVII